MFSTASLTCAAVAAIAAMPSGVKSSATPSVASSAVYWRISDASVSLRMRTKSSRVSPFSSTRIGSRPCSSGSRSLGFETWNAPLTR